MSFCFSFSQNHVPEQKKRYFNKGLCLDMTSGEGFYIYSIFRVLSHEQVYQFGIADVQDCTHSNE